MGTMSAYQVSNGFLGIFLSWVTLGIIAFLGRFGPSTPVTQRNLNIFVALTHGALMGQVSSPFPWLGPNSCPMLGHIWDYLCLNHQKCLHSPALQPWGARNSGTTLVEQAVLTKFQNCHGGSLGTMLQCVWNKRC